MSALNAARDIGIGKPLEAPATTLEPEDRPWEPPVVPRRWPEPAAAVPVQAKRHDKRHSRSMTLLTT